jgi:hypothetical protein
MRWACQGRHFGGCSGQGVRWQGAYSLTFSGQHPLRAVGHLEAWTHLLRRWKAVPPRRPWTLFYLHFLSPSHHPAGTAVAFPACTWLLAIPLLYRASTQILSGGPHTLERHEKDTRARTNEEKKKKKKGARHSSQIAPFSVLPRQQQRHAWNHPVCLPVSVGY